MYGDPLVHPQPEDYWGNVNPVGPRGVYDEAKRFAEAHHHGLPPLPRDGHADRPDLQYLRPSGCACATAASSPTSSRQALKGEPLTIHGDGSQTRSFCYVDDLIEGIWRLATIDFPEPVNIGNPNELSIREFAEKSSRLTGSALDTRIPALPGR